MCAMPLEPSLTMRGLPRLNEPAPEFEARTTHGNKRLSDYRNRWLMLFSHPADFTPVCTTEFIAFAHSFDDFKKRSVELLGLSIDSVYSHLAWVRMIQEKFGVEIPFPIIEDIDMRVANLYGMIHPQASTTQAVRALFLIDPRGILRAMLYYPLTSGRSIPEILRLIDSLQTVDANGVATPANWQPGEKVIIPAPKTVEEMKAHTSNGYECVDWYFCKKSV